MLWTLMLGAPVRSGDHQLGTLGRIIVNNGVANQFTVKPSGIFSGPERIVPISDIVEATQDGVTLDVSEVEWKAYGAFDIDHLVVSDQAAAPNLLEAGPRTPITGEVFDVPTAEASTEERSLTAMAVPLTSKTRVGDHGRLAGLVVDTGIPQQILVEGGGAIPFEQVGRLGEEHIVLGDVPPPMDDAVPPGAMGDAPRGHP